MSIRLLLLVVTSLRETDNIREVNDGVILSRSINTSNDQRLAVRRQQQGTWKTQRSWREDRSRDLDFVWSVGFYFDRQE